MCGLFCVPEVGTVLLRGYTLVFLRFLVIKKSLASQFDRIDHLKEWVDQGEGDR